MASLVGEKNEQFVLPATAPERNTPLAEAVLRYLSPRVKPRRLYAAPKPKIPEVNRHGLVLPIHAASYDPNNLTDWQKIHGTLASEHHLFWPKFAFQAAGSLATKFRESPFNRTELPNFQHRKYHRRHDPFVLQYPTYLIPSDEVMITFLDEAEDVGKLDEVILRLDRMMNGIVNFSSEQEEALDESLQEAASLCSRVVRSEVIFPTHVQVAITQAQRYVPVDFR